MYFTLDCNHSLCTIIYFIFYCIKCKFLFIYFYQTHSSVNIRPETPPNTPQRAHIAAQQSERDRHVLDSPEHCRLSEPLNNHIPPPRFNIPNIPTGPPAVPNNSVDPFVVPGQPAVLNGQVYNNLPADLAAQVAALCYDFNSSTRLAITSRSAPVGQF